MEEFDFLLHDDHFRWMQVLQKGCIYHFSDHQEKFVLYIYHPKNSQHAPYFDHPKPPTWFKSLAKQANHTYKTLSYQKNEIN